MLSCYAWMQKTDHSPLLIVISHLYEDTPPSKVVLQNNTWPSSAGKCKVKVSAIKETQR